MSCRIRRGALGLMLGAAALAAGCRRAAPHSPTSTVPASTPPAIDPAISATLLGGERGLDHVGLAVKDLDAATHVYHDLLGFSRPIEGKLPNGIRNVNYYFTDATYLETLVHWDRARAPWLAQFTDQHTGALFGVLAAHSPEASTAFLAKRGIKASEPYSGTIEVTGQGAAEGAAPEEKWQTFFLPEGLLPGNPLYFISYRRAPRDEFLRKLQSRDVRRLLYHENTALGLVVK